MIMNRYSLYIHRFNCCCPFKFRTKNWLQQQQQLLQQRQHRNNITTSSNHNIYSSYINNIKRQKSLLYSIDIMMIQQHQQYQQQQNHQRQQRRRNYNNSNDDQYRNNRYSDQHRVVIKSKSNNEETDSSSSSSSISSDRMNDMIDNDSNISISQPPSVLNGQLAVISFYDSHGDYYKDEKMIQEYMEEGSIPCTNQEVFNDMDEDDLLPLLPIPGLDDTLTLVEASSIPLIENEDEHCDFILALRKALLHPMLSYQTNLLNRGQKSIDYNTSYIQLWWNVNCYLKVRTSNVIHSSYFFRFPKTLNLLYNNTSNIQNHFIDDINIINKAISSLTTSTTASSSSRSYSQTTLEKAAILIYAAIQYSFPIVYKKGIPIPNLATIKETNPSQKEFNLPPLLCAAQYKYIFGTCRIPNKTCDTYRLYQYAPQEKWKLPHIVVVCHGQFYNIIIGDYTTNNNTNSTNNKNDTEPSTIYQLKPPPGGTIDSTSVLHMIHDQLIAIVEDARKNASSNSNINFYNPKSNNVVVPPQLGWCTTQNRTIWSNDYQQIINYSQKFQDAIHILQSSLFILCLDDIYNDQFNYNTNNTNNNSNNTNSTHVYDRDFALRLWHGGRDGQFRDASKHMGHNRWYDKTIQIVMSLHNNDNNKNNNNKNNNMDSTDTSFGIIGEHSMVDGMPVAEFARYLNQCEQYLKHCFIPFFNSIDSNKKNNNNTTAIPKQVVMVHNIFQDAYMSLSEQDQKHLFSRVRQARIGHIDTTNQYELEILDTSTCIPLVQDTKTGEMIGFGSKFLKLMKLSPDAGIQMVLQLAGYRYFGRTVATYESTHTRRFRHGRTETIRTVSGPSREFCRDITNALNQVKQQKQKEEEAESYVSIIPSNSTDPMDIFVTVNDLDKTVQESIMKIFRRACGTHSAYTRLASEGRGCDRHLFGLEYLIHRSVHLRIEEETEILNESTGFHDISATTTDTSSSSSSKKELSPEMIKSIKDKMIPWLINDPVYKRSKHWRLSTSTLPGTAPGFGPVVEDGFGIGYDIRMNHVIYTITCVRKFNNVQRFVEALQSSMIDVYQLLQNAYDQNEHLQHREKHDLLVGPALMPRYYHV